MKFSNMVNGLDKVMSLNKNLACVSNTLKTETEMFDVAYLMERCIAEYDDMIKGFGIQINTHFDKYIIVNTNMEYLTDIINNIMLNAIYGLYEDTKRYKTLDIYICNIKSAVQIQVIDNGRGIEPEILLKAALRGFTTKLQGHGLGLYIINRLAHEIGATISLKSKEGKGTVINLTLPHCFNFAGEISYKWEQSCRISTGY